MTSVLSAIRGTLNIRSFKVYTIANIRNIGIKAWLFFLVFLSLATGKLAHLIYFVYTFKLEPGCDASGSGRAPSFHVPPRRAVAVSLPAPRLVLARVKMEVLCFSLDTLR